MLKFVSKAAIVVLLLKAVTASAASNTTETAYINLGTATEDFSILLSQLVIDIGRSEHKHVSRNFQVTGTRLVRRSKKSSWVEGNRLSFEAINGDEAKVVRQIHHDMITAAKHLPVKKLGTDVQLAFWLNLHNLTVISHVTDAYPVAQIDRLLFKSKDGQVALYDRQFAEIDGRKWSLADIENHIFTTWTDPLVMYGLFYGNIGSPNIRSRPYSADTVWLDLQDNASEFINSIRGTQIWGPRLAISEHYKRAAVLFPDFDRDVKAHILSLIENRRWHRNISKAKTVSATVDNWRVADFYDGSPLRASRTFAKSFSPTGRFLTEFQNAPIHTRNLLVEIQQRNKRRNPQVRIEEIAPPRDNNPRDNNPRDNK